ncbi:MAG: DNA repair exonuclease [Actinobacteria bacterium]|nr:DNA repair exonuclease [Actinomycetota bacterium]
MRFVHTADWQLGMTRHFLSEEAQARFDAARIDAIAAIGELVATSGAGFVVVAGDVFESNHIARRTVWRALDAMAAIGCPVLLLPGNHDPLNAGSIYRSAEFSERVPDNVRVLQDSDPVEIAPGVEVVGAPWTSKRPLHDPIAEAYADLHRDDATLRILVGHGAVDTLAVDPDDPALISVQDAEAALRDGRIHYVALGDRHSLTDVGGSGRVWYPGAPEPTRYTEVDPGHVLLVDLDHDRCDVRPHRVGRWTFTDRTVDLVGDEDLTRLSSSLDSIGDKARTVAKLRIAGQLTVRGRAELDGILTDAGEVLAALEVAEDLTVLLGDEDVDALELSGFARHGTERISELADRGSDEAAVASDALALLYRLARSA